MNPNSIVDPSEDLGRNEDPQTITKAKGVKINPHKCKKGESNTLNTLGSLINDTAKALKIDVWELHEWRKVSMAPEAVMQSILKTARHWLLNPTVGHIDWSHHPELGYKVFISIDGWIALIQREPCFRGISFQQSTEMDQGIPIWIECTIYRSDLIVPITIREYFVELRTDHPVWREMPRRMMRHKSMQQCARMAFGIHLPEIHCKASQRDPLEEPTLPTLSTSPMPVGSKAILREKLREIPTRHLQPITKT